MEHENHRKKRGKTYEDRGHAADLKTRRKQQQIKVFFEGLQHRISASTG
jgi:hypothetical protein